MEGGIHIYCINLKHRADRWERFSNQPELKTLMKHYTFERFEALNGASLNIQKDERISLRTKQNIKAQSRRSHEELDSAGGIGCYLSHTTLWKAFLKRPEPYAIIFEDDAMIPVGFTEDFQAAMKDATLLPSPPDIWYFAKPATWYYDYKGVPSPYTVKQQNVGPWTIKTCAAFTGYLISKKGAEKLLETAFPIDMHVDLYSCLVGEMDRILTVSHRNVETPPYSLKMHGDTDIQVASDCPICEIPTNYREKGMIVVSVPVLVIGLCVAAGLYYLAGPVRRR